MDIEFIKENLIKNGDNISEAAGHTFMGYFRMYFRSGKWYGKWFAENAEFEKNGVLPEESNKLKSFCKWVEDRFKGGCNDVMTDYLKNNEDMKCINGSYFIGLLISDTSYAMVKYTPQFGNDDYPIRIYLYRKEV